MQGARRQSLWRRVLWQVMDRAQELGARNAGAELSASINGAELRVHFLNSFHQGSICEKLKKRSNCKKFGRTVEVGKFEWECASALRLYSHGWRHGGGTTISH